MNDWKKHNLELLEFDVNIHKVDIKRQSQALKLLARVAREIIKKSTMPVYFDLQQKEYSLVTYNQSLVSALERDLKIRFIYAGATKTYIGSYKGTLVILKHHEELQLQRPSKGPV